MENVCPRQSNEKEILRCAPTIDVFMTDSFSITGVIAHFHRVADAESGFEIIVTESLLRDSLRLLCALQDTQARFNFIWFFIVSWFVHKCFFLLPSDSRRQNLSAN